MKNLSYIWILVFLISAVSTSAALNNADVWHALNSDSGLLDETGIYTATTVSSPTQVTGILEEGYKADSASEYINTGFSIGDATSLSVSFWVNVTSNGITRHILGDGTTGFANVVGYHYATEATGAGVNFLLASTGCNAAAQNPTENVWNHVVLVYNGTHMINYLNNVSIATCAKSGTLDLSQTVMAGYTTGSNSRTNVVDELGIYVNRTFTLDEINELYNAGAGKNPFDGTVGSNFTITTKDNITTSIINTSTANITSNTNYSTTTGTMTTNITDGGTYNLTVDSIGYLQSNFTDYNTSVNLVANLTPLWTASNSFTTPIVEGTLQTITARINTTSGIIGIENATLTWNGTVQNITQQNGSDHFNLTTTFLIPLFPSSSNVSVNWSIWLNTEDGLLEQEFNDLQLILDIGIDNCSTYTTQAINFSIKNEFDDSLLSGAIAGYFEVWVNAASSFVPFNLTWSGSSKHQLCINPNDVQYNINGQLEYAASGFNTKTYYFDNVSISNNTQLIDLFLNNGSTLVTLTVTDENDNSVEGAFIHILSFDIATNSAETTEIVQTGLNGQAFAQLVLNSQFYKFLIFVDGDLKEETSTTIVTSTNLNFRVNLQQEQFSGFNTMKSATCSVSYLNSTDEFKLIFADSSGGVSQGELQVRKQSYTNSGIINSSSLSSASGTIFVGVPDLNATYFAVGILTIDGNDFTCGDSASVNKGSVYKTFGTEGIMMAFLIIATLSMLFISSPVMSILAMALGFIVSIMLGIFFLSWTSLIVFLIMAGVAIFRMGR